MKNIFKRAIERKVKMKISGMEFIGFENNFPVYVVEFENGVSEKWSGIRKFNSEEDRIVVDVWKVV